MGDGEANCEHADPKDDPSTSSCTVLVVLVFPILLGVASFHSNVHGNWELCGSDISAGLHILTIKGSILAVMIIAS